MSQTGLLYKRAHVAEGEPHELQSLSPSPAPLLSILRRAALAWSSSKIQFRRCPRKPPLRIKSASTKVSEAEFAIRFIQQMLGHEDLKTTQIYTQVAIRTPQQIHAATHPGAALDPSNKPVLCRDQEAVEELNRMLAIEAEDDNE